MTFFLNRISLILGFRFLRVGHQISVEFDDLGLGEDEVGRHLADLFLRAQPELRVSVQAGINGEAVLLEKRARN